MPAARNVSYLPVLDGLRALAVLLVMWAHVDPGLPGYPAWLWSARFWFDPGVQGVDLFFVLSGFLITRILLAERQRGLPLRRFLLRRLLRIFPIYYLLLLVMAVVRGGDELPWCALYLSNFWFAFTGGTGPLEHTWSLCVEEHFYLLWPPVVAFCARGRALLAILLGFFPLAIASVWWVLATMAPEHWLDALYYLSPIRFASLGCGCLMAFGEGHIAAHARRYLLLGAALVLSGLLCMPGFVYRAITAFELRALLQPEVLQLTPLVNLISAMCLSTGAMLCCLTAGRRLPWRLLEARPLRAIGRISYGLYLYHMPIFLAVAGAVAGWSGVALAVALSFLAAGVSFVAIERPILRFAARYR